MSNEKEKSRKLLVMSLHLLLKNTHPLESRIRGFLVSEFPELKRLTRVPTELSCKNYEDSVSIHLILHEKNEVHYIDLLYSNDSNYFMNYFKRERCGKIILYDVNGNLQLENFVLSNVLLNLLFWIYSKSDDRFATFRQMLKSLDKKDFLRAFKKYIDLNKIFM